MKEIAPGRRMLNLSQSCAMFSHTGMQISFGRAVQERFAGECFSSFAVISALFCVARFH
jgi:hypothetical protein